MSLKRSHPDSTSTSPSSSSTATNATAPQQFFESSPIQDRSSTFTAIFVPSSTSQTFPNPKAIQNHEPFKTASHKMLAWRKRSNQSTINAITAPLSLSPLSSSSSNQSSKSPAAAIYSTHSDDDGEKYSGKKLEKVLTEMNVEGVVVVARWYGGVMLGPVRFKWIEDCAREAVGKYLAWQKENGREGDGAKRVKVDGEQMSSEDETREKTRLKKVLKDRDTSIDVLRGLLTGKNEEVKRMDTGSVDEEHATKEAETPGLKSPEKAKPDYEGMTLQRLKQLEKARDATIGWILKQLDAVEAKLELRRQEKKNALG